MVVAEENKQLHIVLVTFPAQGHINPALQFAKRLVWYGAQVTFTTTLAAHRRISSNNTTNPTDGLTFAPFYDGYENGIQPNDDPLVYTAEFKRCGSEHLIRLVKQSAEQGHPVTGIIYTLLISWAAEVGLELHIPSTLLWIQPATVFDVYYYYFNGYRQLIAENNDNPSSSSIELPGLPKFAPRDLPSFLLPSSPNTYTFIIQSLEEQFQVLQHQRQVMGEKVLKVLVNTFDDLENDALRAVDSQFDMVGIGPLIPSAFLDGKDPSDKSFGGDLFKGCKDNDYIEWLNSKKKASVVYVSFGSFAVLDKKQMEELARALIESGRPFLWVIRKGEEEEGKEEDEVVRNLRQGDHEGMIVPWCSQVEVLSHPSLGCFVTHCGWNSTTESLAMGVPLVAFPQWTDQGTNAKLIEDVWQTGVRVKANIEDNIVESEEIKRCLAKLMDGKEGEQMRMNAKKWKDLARKAVAEGGSSDKNLTTFLEEIRTHFHQLLA